MTQRKIYQIPEWCLWILNPFLLVLAIFLDKTQPGLFLQWLGKFHPLMLHFPIVFGILISIYFLFFQQRRFPLETEKLLLVINALISSIVAVFGLLLARENASNGDLILIHKWGGVAIAFLSWMYLSLLHSKPVILKIYSIIFLSVLTIATHKGAQLTHGINALSFPESSKSENQVGLFDENATVYEVAIAPILEQKCVTCHGPDKAKGDLRLNTPENILKGGEDGNIFGAGLDDDGFLLKRIHLPLSDDDHMPPDGKVQLTKDEISILNNWIKSGANFNLKMNELAEEDSLYKLVRKPGPENTAEVISDKPLPDLAEFNSNYCSVNALFPGSDRVVVNFFQGSFYNLENLKKLEKIKENIVELNMQGMPLDKEDLDIITQFLNLEKLNINYTGLEIGSLENLKTLSKLQSLSICGIDCDEASLEKLLNGANFTTLNAWSENVNAKGLEDLMGKYPNVKITIGDNLESEFLQLNEPLIDQDSAIIPDRLTVNIRHYLNGVDIRYTTDGSEPDSVESKRYTGALVISENTVLKAKAFKEGWTGSKVVQRSFYKSEIRPDTVYLITNPNPKYKASGAKTLFDLELGERNTSNGKWLGYKDSDLEFVIGFNWEQTLKSASFNALINLGAYIFPIHSISISGSNDGLNFISIANAKFPEAKKGDHNETKSFECNLPADTSFKYYQFNVSNLKKLPDWHAAKGNPAWIFIDELFLK